MISSLLLQPEDLTRVLSRRRMGAGLLQNSPWTSLRIVHIARPASRLKDSSLVINDKETTTSGSDNDLQPMEDHN